MTFVDPLVGGDIDLTVVLIVIGKTIATFALLLVAVLFYIWFLRKVIADMQNRIGPAKAGPFGILQSLADGIKLFFKEQSIPRSADRAIFRVAPYLSIVPAFLAFAIGSVLGLGIGLWLALAPTASALAEPYITALNAMPRVILAPIFAVWFGLGVLSKVALGVTLVFFIVFFNVYQGVKEVSPVVLANARMLGASKRQLLRYIYLPSATSWVFSSLHTSVGMAFVGAVVGEYLGSAKGVGYLILQAEGVFDINTVIAGIVVLTLFALLLDIAVSKIEARLLVWRPQTAETATL